MSLTYFPYSPPKQKQGVAFMETHLALSSIRKMLLRFGWDLVTFEAVPIHMLFSAQNPSSSKPSSRSETLFISVIPNVCANQFSSCQFLFINNANERIEILPDFNRFFHASIMSRKRDEFWYCLSNSKDSAQSEIWLAFAYLARTQEGYSYC